MNTGTDIPEDSIYLESTPSRDLALGELWELLNRVGFELRKKSPRESTLRVYPTKYRQYPLLNPRFFETAADLDTRFDRGCLVFDVYTRPVANTWSERLRLFPSSAECAFIEDGTQHSGGYYHHGCFVLPLEFVGDPAEEHVDFPLLEKPLTRIYRFLNGQTLQ